MKKLWNYLSNLIPCKCNDCGIKMKRNERILMASVSIVGIYYIGDGICQKCVDKRMYEALEG